ncbi:MAG: hypothetical protein HC906_03355 [Bacteroidales bacterium]|nr:hypothetical protein [Bacteroidales bacterium]
MKKIQNKMMRYFSVLLTMFCLVGYSQELVLNRTIHWDQNKSINFINKYIDDPEHLILYFENAFYNQNETNFPIYTELIEAQIYYPNYQIKLENPVFSAFSQEELTGVQNLDKLSDEVTVNSVVQFYEKEPFFNIKILPVRKNPVTGTIEKLISFTLKISKTNGITNPSIQKNQHLMNLSMQAHRF